MRILILANILGTLGIYLELGGGSWDVATHILRGGKGTDDFWTAPHSALYAGVALLGLGSLGVIPLTLVKSLKAPSHLTLGLRIILLGSILQGFAGGFDQWWHATKGPDVVIFSPPHATLIVAMALNAFAMALSTTRLREAVGTSGPGGGLPWSLHLQILSLTTLWIALNAQVYLFTDTGGIRYTFGIDLEPYTAGLTLLAILVLAVFGTLLLLLAERLGGPGAPTGVALLMAATMAIATMVPLGRWPYIPVYLTMAAPVALLDYTGRRFKGGLPLILRAMALAPFAFALDGWYSYFVLPALAKEPLGALTFAVALTAVVGLLGLRFSKSLGRVLEGREKRPAATAP